MTKIARWDEGINKYIILRYKIVKIYKTESVCNFIDSYN